MKYALITGGTRGVGLATVRRFFDEGYLVTALYSNHEKDAENARALLPYVSFVRADVSDEEAVKRAIDSLPALDVLVNNAGVSLHGQVQDTSLADWERTLSVNAGGMFLCCKYATPRLLQRGGGSVVNVASVWGETGGSCESAYSASKGAVIAFTKALAKELAPAGITVNCVSPGVIETDMNAFLTVEERKSLEDEIPMGRFGAAEEVADAIYRLSQFKYVTGQVLGVNGGFLI